MYPKVLHAYIFSLAFIKGFWLNPSFKEHGHDFRLDIYYGTPSYLWYIVVVLVASSVAWVLSLPRGHI